MRADGEAALELLRAREHEVGLGGELGLPAWRDDDGLVRLDDDRGALHAGAGLELVARIDAGLVLFTLREEACLASRGGELRRRLALPLLGKLGAAADRLDRHGLDHHLLAAVDEAETRLVRLLEGVLHRLERAGVDDERRVGAGIANVRAHDQLYLGFRHALARDLGDKARTAIERTGGRLGKDAVA